MTDTVTVQEGELDALAGVLNTDGVISAKKVVIDTEEDGRIVIQPQISPDGLRITNNP